MIKKIKYIFLFTFILVSLTSLSADNDNPIRSFDQAEMQSYAESSDFDYMNLVIQPPSIWQRIRWWFQSLLQKIFTNANATLYVKIVFYIILFTVLGAAVFYIVRLKYGGAITNDSKKIATNISFLEHTNVKDFEGMIAGAIRDENYKLAIRYVYLQSLTMLSQRELIKLKDWKSPYDYEKELSTELIAPYKNLSRLFEYVWYGEFEAGEEEYERSYVLAKEMEKGK